MRSLVVALCVASATFPAHAKEPAADAKRVVDHFVGTWKLDGTVSGLPGTKGPAKTTETVTCQRAAEGLVVSCAGRGKVEGLGKVEDAVLVAWDGGAKNVRFVGMSSMGDIHDHVCSWKDDSTLACEPLSATMDGDPVTVALQLHWVDAKHVTFNETTTTKDGGKIAFEAKGTRK